MEQDAKQNVDPQDRWAAVASRQRKFLNEYVHDLALNLLSEFHEEGFDIQSKVFDKNFGFVVESMRSMLYATYDIEHPFQEIVDKCVKLIDEIDETEHANDDEEFNQS